MKIIFFGNTKYSLIGATILHQALGISSIVTLPASPLTLLAKKHSIPLLTANKLEETVIKQLTDLKPDFLVVEDYGLILPAKILRIPRYAPLNVHHSLLPKYRGPAPAPTAILNGESISGVSIINMTDTVDAGDIYAQKAYKLRPDETTDSLLKSLNELGGELVVQVINDIVAGKARAKKQDENEATFTHYMKKSDGYISLDAPPDKTTLDRMIRAYYPWPGVWTRMKINRKDKVVKFLPENKLQVEGKKPMSLKDFYNGYPQAKEQITKPLHEKI